MLFKYKYLDTAFTLVVDNFGIKYSSKANALHLNNYLRCLYKITTDWSESLYIGITLDRNYIECYVDLFMPGYIEKALLLFTDKFPHMT